MVDMNPILLTKSPVTRTTSDVRLAAPSQATCTRKPRCTQGIVPRVRLRPRLTRIRVIRSFRTLISDHADAISSYAAVEHVPRIAAHPYRNEGGSMGTTGFERRFTSGDGDRDRNVPDGLDLLESRLCSAPRFTGQNRGLSFQRFASATRVRGIYALCI